jgi:hypothetical protein
MSSSAFTPTTTQVTTEVPVNVPVVTAWQSYTPTYAAGAISGTTLSGFWRRQGDTLETKIRIQGSASSSLSATTTSLNYLPSGLTVDTSKLPTRPSDRGLTSTGMCFGSFSNSVYNPCMLEIENPTTTARIQVLKTDNASPFAATNFSALNTANFASTALNAVDRFMEFHLSVPISQWSSGVTTLADRALEEYAFNTSTSTNTSDTTSFGYGPQGALIQNITGAGGLDRTVQFTTPILASDVITVEILPPGAVNSWIQAGRWGGVDFGFANQNGVLYGVGIFGNNNSNNQVTVRFGQYAYNVSTYGAAGVPWSTTGGNYRWRVRKVSSGAQVGYPISTRNIVGDTSGTDAPAGMIGEVLRATRTAISEVIPGVSGTWYDTSLSLNLSPGVWTINISALNRSYLSAYSSGGVVMYIAACTGTTASPTVLFSAALGLLPLANIGQDLPMYATRTLTITSETTVKLFYRRVSSGTNTSVNTGLTGSADIPIVLEAVRTA